MHDQYIFRPSKDPQIFQGTSVIGPRQSRSKSSCGMDLFYHGILWKIFRKPTAKHGFSNEIWRVLYFPTFSTSNTRLSGRIFLLIQWHSGSDSVLSIKFPNFPQDLSKRLFPFSTTLGRVMLIHWPILQWVGRTPGPHRENQNQWHAATGPHRKHPDTAVLDLTQGLGSD